MPHWLKYLLLLLVFLMIAAIPLAMMQPETGSIEGMITDEFGPVAHASIEARNLSTGAVGHADSDGVGYYKLASLHAGRYSLWVEAPNHDSVWIAHVLVVRGETTQSDVRMKRIVTPTGP